MIILKTTNLSKVYNPDTVPVHALKDVSISFEKGEFTSIVGPSGSGKTTLLNMLGGLDNPTSGTVEVDGQVITGMKDGALIDFRLHNIGFVFQHYNLIPVFTALENVSFIMLLQNRKKDEMEARARNLLEAVGLGERLDARPKQLSGGQQQRVAVARALASEPKFILADEPTANLDSASAMNLLDIMEKMNREQNITFIFSTHDQRVIDRARRVVTMVDGAISKDERMKEAV
ncbi:putative ABC transport system ATP-binding protein [Cyclonatronum proteinivorum]|uniref:Putative ABC transport system ATP-binding protein n=1 Tax=Cyclonatronum proteinivorum TaxID=1457365 RepID=A0A345UG26_9BACT|nr:ABC transporter ATP-binding protein [Cyclonatronum proteinivorum]AXI99427.1 putative ABC transport system ATP-binding protein [Cyclonatronum proteinivorum]